MDSEVLVKDKDRDKNNSPELRFPEFIDEYQRRQLGDIGTTYSGLTGKSGDDFGSGAPFITYMQIFSSTSIGGNFGRVRIGVTESQNRAQYGDIFFTTSSETPQETGYTSVLLEDVGYPLYLNSFCFGYRVERHKLRPEFAQFLFHSPRVRRSISKLAQGSTRFNLSKNSLMKLTIQLPSIPEQQKIASFLTAVDQRITKQQQKLSLLKDYKKGVMQKLFTQQIRFKDESGEEYPEWVVKKLGEVFSEQTTRGGVSDRMLSVTINSGVVPFDTIDRKDNSSADKSKYKLVETGDIAYNSMRMWQGASGVSQYDGIVSPAYTVIRANADNNPIYWGYYFKLTEMIQTFERHSQGLTSDTWNLKYGALSRIKVKMASYKEQQKIADLLTLIDSKIKAEENLLTSAKAWKKGLLQRMFI